MMSTKNMIFGVLGFIFTLIGFFGKALYRPYIHHTHLNDYGISDFLPSYFYVIGFSLLLLIKPFRYPILIVIIVTLGSIVYEIMQYSSHSILDFPDILASFAGGISAIFLLKYVDHRNKFIKHKI